MSGPTERSATHRYRFRLIRCHTCGWRTWAVDPEVAPSHEHDDLWEAHSFFADDREGPGFPLTQATGG